MASKAVYSVEDLLGDSSSFTNMSAKEREYFTQLLKEEIKRRDDTSKAEQIRDIVPVEQWINSRYFVGPDADSVYPYWKDVIVDIFRTDRKADETINSVVLSGAIGVGKSCLVETTRVPTSIGNLTLKELYQQFHSKGNRFQVLSESGWKDCTDVYDNGEDDTVKLTMKSGRTVQCTGKHKFRVVRDKELQWVKASELRVSDKFVMTRKESPFGKYHLNLDEAYTIGYMLGDGWCEKSYTNHVLNGKYSSFCVMYQEEQEDVSSRINRAWLRWFDKVTVSQRTMTSQGNNLVTIRGYNSKLAGSLVHSGFGSGAKNKGIPNFMYQCDKESVCMFLRGLMDSDGTIGTNSKIDITLKSEEVIDGVMEFFSNLGINCTKSIKANKTYGDFYRLLIVNNESYLKYQECIGFSIDYKKARLDSYCASIREGLCSINNRMNVPDCCECLRDLDGKEHLVLAVRNRNLNSFRTQDNFTLEQLKKLYEFNTEWVSVSDYLQYVCTQNVYFDELVSIEDSGKAHTMDLTIDTDHSYCFNGFISHNTCAELIMMRKLYEMSCWKNINALYHLMSKNTIMFLYFSVNKTQAQRGGFGEISSLVRNSPYLKENFAPNPHVKEALVFPENLMFAYGSGSQHAIGMTVIGTIMDEANFIGNTTNGNAGNTQKASELYTSIVNRSASRFIIDGGINHSLNILVSSSTHESSLTEQQIQSSHGNKHMYISAPSQWEVKPDKFSKKFFFVCTGTDYSEPQVIHSVDDVNNIIVADGLPKVKFLDGEESYDKIDKALKELPPHMQSKFMSVPEDLKLGFETNIMRSLQDLGGISVSSSGKLFNSVSVYNACINKNFHHPFVSDSITISTGDTIKIQDYLRDDFRLKYPERPRYLHIDQSYRTDDTGISCVYADEVLDEDGVKKPVIGVDFMLQINPPKPPKKIAIYKIRDFVIWLSQVMNMKIGKITYDIFNSEESRQILEEMGFNVGYQSVDRTDKAYLDTVELMYEGRIRMYDYKVFRKEIFNVVHYRDKRKVDHTQTNTDGCFLGNTLIKCLDGTNQRIEDLVGKTDVELYGCLIDGRIVPTVAKRIWKTKEVTQYLRITLDNGETIECTENHRFMLWDGTYKEAKDIEIMLEPIMGTESWQGFDGEMYQGRLITIRETIHSDTPVSVYDIEVPITNNFALTSGIFVHNSKGTKDVADSLVGACENLISEKVEQVASSNTGVSDFLYANSTKDMLRASAMSAEELVDRQIEDMIDEMSMDDSVVGGIPWMG